jgi:hypothetical protein
MLQTLLIYKYRLDASKKFSNDSVSTLNPNHFFDNTYKLIINCRGKRFSIFQSSFGRVIFGGAYDGNRGIKENF